MLQRAIFTVSNKRDVLHLTYILILKTVMILNIKNIISVITKRSISILSINGYHAPCVHVAFLSRLGKVSVNCTYQIVENCIFYSCQSTI